MEAVRLLDAEHREQHDRIMKLRLEAITRIDKLDVTFAHSVEPVPYSERDKLEFKPIYPGTVWSENLWECAWFHFKGKVPEIGKGKHVCLNIDIGGEGLAYDKDKPSGMVTSVGAFVEWYTPARGKTLIDVSTCAKGGEEIDLYVDGGFNSYYNSMVFKGIFWRGDIVIVNDKMCDFLYDYIAVAYLLCTNEDKKVQAKIEADLDKAYLALGNRTDKDIDKARAILKGYIHGKPDDFKITAVGHSHLDLAWLWPIRESKRKAARTFTKQLELIDKYPDYIYGASQPQQYEWLKEEYPSIYEKVKEQVKKGRIEPQGGMWVEADTNIVSGEALIRQLYYGKKFFHDEFGKDMRICWLPDVFGYNANLPQILLKSGIPYFMTIKISWNEHNKFPHRNFNWRGIDDSEVLVAMPTDETYNSMCTPACVKHTKTNMPEADVVGEGLFLYGVGDGGGGPSEIYIELLERAKSMEGIPQVKNGFAIDFFDRLNKKRSKLIRHDGELYLEKHQGTYTSQARNKNFNRRVEYELADLEAIYTLCQMTKEGKTAIDSSLAKDFVYPQAKLDKWWKEILLYQFHDIIPGSSIQRVYELTRKRYAEILEEVRSEKQRIFKMLASGGEKSVYNPTSFERNEYIKLGDKWYSSKVAPFGTAKLVEAEEAKNISFKENENEIILENQNLKVVVNRKGQVTSIVEKKDNFEHAKGLMNELRIYQDKKLHYNAWDIDWKYMNEPFEVLEAQKLEVGKDGVEVFVKATYVHGESTIVQKIRLVEGGETVEFINEADWHETHRMLRAEFEPSVYADQVKCDIQLGSFMRSTHDETSVEEAQFEICAHKYIELEQGDKAFSLLNDNKYGNRVKTGRVSLNLLRAPVYPDRTCDRGQHKFTYVVFPHTKSNTDTTRYAYFINKQEVVFDGEIPSISLARSNNPAVIVETVKYAGDASGVVVRVYNNSNEKQVATISSDIKFTKVLETNLVEEGGEKASLENLTFKPFEIRTFKLV